MRRLSRAYLGLVLAFLYLPILVMVFGTGIPVKMANAGLHTIFPVLINALAGMREINPLLVKAVRSFGAKGPKLLWSIHVPSIGIVTLAGMELALSGAFLGCILAELFVGQGGLGYLVNFYYSSGRIAEMIVVIAAGAYWFVERVFFPTGA